MWVKSVCRSVYLTRIKPNMGNKIIEVKTAVNVPVKKVWELWTTPEHIKNWNRANEQWHTPMAENDLRPGGKFVSRMEAKDGSMSFDFGGTYDKIDSRKLIVYSLEDGRKVEINFESEGDSTNIKKTFEAEKTNPVEMQQSGWQAILDNFKKYAEAKT